MDIRIGMTVIKKHFNIPAMDIRMAQFLFLQQFLLTSSFSSSSYLQRSNIYFDHKMHCHLVHNKIKSETKQAIYIYLFV